MNLKFCFSTFFLVVFVVLTNSCKEKVEDPVLIVSATEITFQPEGGDSLITINCNDTWKIGNSAPSWIQLSKANGSGGTNINIKITATSANTTGALRSTILVISADNGQARRITISQPNLIFPSYNTSPKAPDATGMGSTAAQLLAKMKLGWNIGNTFEAPGGETGWGNPVVTEDYIKFVKQCGFNAIRIPCAWNWYHIDNTKTAHIDPNWLNRVKEVVNYCVKNDMYVLLNIHWDGGWLENNCTVQKKDSVNAKQKAIWEQIATTMRDFDEHLMFASANEPNAGNASQMSVLLSYHKTFVKAVRSTGGHNTYRALVLQGDDKLMTVADFPTDPTPNRLIYESHNYTPSQFCFLNEDVSWGKMAYYWGQGNHSDIEPERNATYGEEDDLLKGFKSLKDNFIDKGIPVLMGEYGAYRRTTPKELEKHNKSVDDWITFVTKQCRNNGIVPFFWDTGGILDRRNCTVKDQRSLDAIITGGKTGKK